MAYGFELLFADLSCNMVVHKMQGSSQTRHYLLPPPAPPYMPCLTSIQVSPDIGLVQSSTVADQIAFKFERGQEGMVAGSYLEFAQRAVLPQFKHLPVSHLLYQLSFH